MLRMKLQVAFPVNEFIQAGLKKENGKEERDEELNEKNWHVVLFIVHFFSTKLEKCW